MGSTGSVSAFFRGEDKDESRMFVQRLNQFKHTGCSILVTGSADEDVFNQQLAHAFGTQDCKQVLVTPHALDNPNRVLPAGVSPADKSVELLRGDHGRHTASSTPTSGTSLATLSDAVLDAVHRLDNEFSLDDNDLRVGVKAVDQFSDDARPQAVSRFVRSLSQTVEFVNGTLYCQTRDSPEQTKHLMESGVFDARIELRTTSRAEQRWHLPEDEITTDWVEL